MAHPVTPSPDLIVDDWPADAPHDTSNNPEGWAGLPADLLFRVSGLLDTRNEVPCLLATCRSWHCSLKSALTALRLQSLGPSALGIHFSSVRSVDASLRRSAPSPSRLALAYLAPLRNPERLATQFPSLVSLNISGQDLGNQGLKVLQPLAGRLLHLDCSGCLFSSVDLATLGMLSQLTSLVLNAIRPAPVKQQPINFATMTTPLTVASRAPSTCKPEVPLATELASAVLPRLSQLRRLELCMGELLNLHSTFETAIGQPPLQGQIAPTHLLHHQFRPVGLPMLKLVSHLTSLQNLSCLLLCNQELHSADVAALASMSGLTRLAMSWHHRQPSLHLSGAVWTGFVSGPVGQSLQILEVDLMGWDIRERLSLVPLRQLRALRLRRCHLPDLVLSLMRSTAAGAAAHVQMQSGMAAAAGAGQGSPAVRGSGGGGSSGGSGGGAVHWGSCGVPGAGLVRLELPEAGEHVTAALVAQVCSRLPVLRMLDVSKSFRSRARFQLGGDLLVRDLAVLCPFLVQLVLQGVPLHGLGLPDGRDLSLLPFVTAAAAPAEEGSRSASASADEAGPPSCSSPSRSAAAAAELVQLPFPRLTSLVVQGSPTFMKSRFRSFAHLRSLQQLRIEGMTEKDFQATCKMGCYEPLSGLTALTTLHILAPTPAQQLQLPGPGGFPPPPLPPPPPPELQPILMPWEVAPVAQNAAQAAPAAPAPQVNAAAAFGLGQAGPGPAGGDAGAGAAGGGGGPSHSSRSASSQLRPEPHLNFITQLSTLRVLTLESLATRGRVFSYLAQLPHLRALSLGGCIDFSEDGLQSMRRSCMPGLRSLRMLGCVWEEGLNAWGLISCLPGTTPFLEQLELGASPGVTAERLASLVAPSAATQSGPPSASAGPGGSVDGLAGRQPGPGGMQRLRYVRLYGAPINPDAVRQQQAALSLGSLCFLDFVVPAPYGSSFSMVRNGDSFELVPPKLEEGAGGRWWRYSSSYGDSTFRGVAGPDSAFEEPRVWDITALDPDWEVL